jgi:hypothetical protein
MQPRFCPVLARLKSPFSGSGSNSLSGYPAKAGGGDSGPNQVMGGPVRRFRSWCIQPEAGESNALCRKKSPNQKLNGVANSRPSNFTSCGRREPSPRLPANTRTPKRRECTTVPHAARNCSLPTRSTSPGAAGRASISRSRMIALSATRIARMACDVSRSPARAADPILGTFFRTGLVLPDCAIALTRHP